jgi:hypothetical protein
MVETAEFTFSKRAFFGDYLTKYCAVSDFSGLIAGGLEVSFHRPQHIFGDIDPRAGV